MGNKHLRMIIGIIAYPFKVRRNYWSLYYAAKDRQEQKQMERRMHMRSLCGR